MKEPKTARPIKLLDNDTCSKGHDVRNKDEALLLYTSGLTTRLVCKQCVREYNRQQNTRYGMTSAERSRVRAENNAKIRERNEQKRKAEQDAKLVNKLVAKIQKLNDEQLTQLLDIITR